MSRSLARWLALAFALVHCGGAVQGDGPASSAPDASQPDTDATCEPGSPDCGPGDAATEDASAGDTGPEDVSQSDDEPATSDADAEAEDAPTTVDVASEDAGVACAPMTAGPCDPIAQCGCPAGYACGFAPMGTSSYCRLVGTVGPYEYCQYDNECAAGLGCSLKQCRAYCLTESDCEGTDPYRKCWHGESFFTMQPYGLCNRQCDPLHPQSTGGGYWACGAGFHCRAFKTGETSCESWSAQPSVAIGEVCTTPSQCPSDADCRAVPGDGGGDDAGAELRCLRWCHVGDACPNGATCADIGYFAGATPVGLCPP